MRLLAGLVASGLVSLAAASPEPDAAIFDLSNPTQPGESRGVRANLDDVKLALARNLGTTRFHSLGVQDPTDRRIEVLGGLASSNDFFAAEKGRFVLSLAGVPDVDSLSFGSPALRFDGSSSAREWVEELASAKFSAMDMRIDEPETYLFGDSFCSVVPTSSSLIHESTTRQQADYSTWQSGGYEAPDMSKQLISEFKHDSKVDSALVNDYLALNAFIDTTLRHTHGKEAFAFCHFTGLDTFASVYDVSSPEVSRAVTLYAQAIKLATEYLPTTLIVTPPGAKTSSYSKRAETPLSLSIAEETPQPSSPASKHAGPLAANVARCPNTKDSCNNSTRSCSGHGECKETTKDCWTCSCNATTTHLEGGSVQRTYWAGNACQKKDISLPFNIFLVFTIAIVLVIGWAISLLYSIGEEPLPSVLSAGVAPTKRA